MASFAWIMAFIKFGLPATIARTSPTLFYSITLWQPWAQACLQRWQRHMVHPDRKVLAICGDGGFMMNSQELETAVREKMNIAVLILNDNSYGMIRWKQANMGFDDWGLQYGNPDFVKYVESYGGIGHRVESAEALPGILEDCAFDARGTL